MITLEVIRGVAQLGEKLELAYGESLRVNASFRYRGIAQVITLHGSVGNQEAEGFTEILSGDSQYSMESSLEWVEVAASVDISITDAIAPGVYDLRCSILEFPEVWDGVDDVIIIAAAPAPPTPAFPFWLLGVGIAATTLALAKRKPSI